MSSLGQSAALLLYNTYLWILSMFGITPQSGQILHVLPGRAATVLVKGRSLKVDSRNGATNGHVDGRNKNSTKSPIQRGTNNTQQSVTRFILDHCPSINGVFKPAWWAQGGHAQTMYCVVGNFNQVDKVEYERHLLRVPDGGTVAVDITPPNHASLPEDAPTVIVAHGLTGGSHESYVRNILEWVVRPKSEGGLGGRGVVSNYRGCAGSPLTSFQFYSAGYTGDYHTVVSYIASRYTKSPLVGLGFSLGAGVMARYVGEQKDRCLLRGGVSVAAPWDIAQLSHHLETGWFSSRVYSSSMAQNLTRVVGRHLAPDVFLRKNERQTFTPSASMETYLEPFGDLSEHAIAMKKKGRHLRMRDFDDFFTAKIGGLHKDRGGAFPFEGADEYYAWASSKHYIKDIRRPLLGINSFDDPIVHGAALPVEEVTNSSHVVLAVTAHGGHLGWFDGPFFRNKKTKQYPQQRWVLRPFIEFCTALVDELDPSTFGDLSFEMENGQDEDGWEWVKGSEEHQVYGRTGWKVVQVGGRVHGAESSGVIAGL